MARPIMFRAQTDAALLVLTLVVVAERIASSFSRRVIKPASRKHAPRCLEDGSRWIAANVAKLPELVRKT